MVIPGFVINTTIKQLTRWRTIMSSIKPGCRHCIEALAKAYEVEEYQVIDRCQYGRNEFGNIWLCYMHFEAAIAKLNNKLPTKVSEKGDNT